MVALILPHSNPHHAPPARYPVPMRFGERGEWYVVGQFALLGLLVLALWLTPSSSPSWLTWLGRGLSWLGLGVLLLAAWQLGRNLTALPKPKPGGYLVRQGMYRVVRHPIYCGVLLWALGSSLAHLNPWTVLLCGLLFALLDRKASLEEHWLQEHFPEYESYRRRVKKLIPWIY
ncbi:methyltransferase family protein [Meiothermus cerbereus]|uniref:methyltransferase family protein n=1 Tax=Meiothermus cerbereus TaxID=65552 RepID=UPI000A05BD43|nr:isoprenylcysteine carboxylmethyltransferase family protein [Meiothermus cerbereus]